MKKTTKILALILSVVMIFGMFALTACNDNKDDGKTKIVVWVSETEGIKTLTEQQVASFFEANPDYAEKYTVQVEGISESEAATQMITDVTTGADIYCFAQDQLGRLVEANALSALGQNAVKFVSDNNDAGSVRASQVGDKTYCYPITSDNGYFMYYDKSVIAADHINDLKAIVDDCVAANKKFAFELEGSAWYTASFFFGAGCTSAWSMNPETKVWTANDNFNSANGIIALKGMQILTKSAAYVNSSKAAEFGDAAADGSIKGGAAVVVSGTWDSATAKEKLGDNYAVAKLPSFTVDGKTYQLGSFSGFKLMGVKPHKDTEIQAFCHALAQELSGKAAQEARFDLKGWGPSNKEVQGLDKVKNDEALAALAAQNVHGTPQGNIHGGWWDIAKLLGTVSKDANSDEDLQTGLNTYADAIAKYETMPEEDMYAYGIVGKIASLSGLQENLAFGQTTWADWSADLKMVKSEDGKTWTSIVPVVLAAGDEFQVRQGQAWSVQFGAVAEDGFSTKDNFVINAENAGTYTIKLVLDDSNGTLRGTVSLVPAE